MRDHYQATKRWRLAHPGTRYRGKANYYRRLAVGRPNKRQLWMVHEIHLIMSEGRPCDRILAEHLGRSVAAIQGMRCLAKKG